MLQTLRFPLAFGLIISLAACVTTGSNSVGTLPDTRYVSLEKTLAQSGKKKGQDATALYLAAADMAWQQGDSLKARTLLESLDLDDATPAHKMFANTLAAELALARKQPEMALQLLQDPAFERLTELPVTQQTRSQEVKAEAFEATGELLQATRERIFIAGLLSKQAADINLEKTWSLVSRLPATTEAKSHEADLQGWLSLSTLIRSNSTLEHKQQSLRDWINTHKQHPAAIKLPAELNALLTLQPKPLQRIGLFCPARTATKKWSTPCVTAFWPATTKPTQTRKLPLNYVFTIAA